MMRAGLLAAIASVGWLFARPAAAVQILPVQDDRIVSWTLLDGTPEEQTPGPGFPSFDGLLNIVGGPSTSQSTSVGATQMGGTGSVFVNTDEARDVRSAFDVTFQVDERVAYQLSGLTLGHASEIVFSSPSAVLFEGDPNNPGFFPFDATGTLQPGIDYRLRVDLEVPDGDACCGEWEFTFTVSAPEPGSSSLLGLGIAVIATAARRARRAQTPTSQRSGAR